MTEEKGLTLDLSRVPRGERDGRVLGSFDALPSGGVVTMIVDHPPRSFLILLQNVREVPFDWSPLEEGPERWRVELRKLEPDESPGRSVASYLHRDHGRLDGLLEEARGLVSRDRIAEASERFAEFRTGLLRHIRMEEEVLFPAFEELTGQGRSGPTEVMRAEHFEIRRLLDAMRGWLADPERPPAGFEALRAAFGSVLAGHNDREEHVVYPLTDRNLLPHQREDLIRRMQAV